MKKILYSLILLSPVIAFTQKDSIHTKSNHTEKTTYFGIKAGLNFANVTNASSIGASGQTGWHAGVLANLGGKLICFRLEVLYSQQGYGFATDSSSGSFTHDYISMSQLIGINITHWVQVQIGGQTGYLLNAKATSKTQSTGNATVDNILSYYNRFDYGFGGGLELHPIAGLLIGARYNISLSNLYNNTFISSGGGSGNYTPNIDFKNNVVQLFVGYRF